MENNKNIVFILKRLQTISSILCLNANSHTLLKDNYVLLVISDRLILCLSKLFLILQFCFKSNFNRKRNTFFSIFIPGQNSNCSQYHFECLTGGCIHISQVCDFISDCPDSSDESCGK
jgi:hypothetical protein